MMRTGLRIRRRRDEGEENIVPLINIVFLLLIFFMLTGHLAAPEPFDIDPPESRSEAESGRSLSVVLVSADGRIALDGEETDEAGLSEAVAAKVTGAPGFRVHLKADGGTDAGRVVSVMEALRGAGVTELTLLTAASLR